MDGINHSSPSPPPSLPPVPKLALTCRTLFTLLYTSCCSFSTNPQGQHCYANWVGERCTKRARYAVDRHVLPSPTKMSYSHDHALMQLQACSQVPWLQIVYRICLGQKTKYLSHSQDYQAVYLTYLSTDCSSNKKAIGTKICSSCMF